MRENVEHAFDAQRLAHVDARDAAFGDRRRDDGRVGKAVDIMFAGIFGGARHLGMTIDAGGGCADIGHGAHRTFLEDWDCGVARAAWVRARTTARRARSILKALCARPLASRSNASAACMNASRFAVCPRSNASTPRSRQGLWA